MDLNEDNSVESNVTYCSEAEEALAGVGRKANSDAMLRRSQRLSSKNERAGLINEELSLMYKNVEALDEFVDSGIGKQKFDESQSMVSTPHGALVFNDRGEESEPPTSIPKNVNEKQRVVNKSLSKLALIDLPVFGSYYEDSGANLTYVKSQKGNDQVLQTAHSKEIGVSETVKENDNLHENYQPLINQASKSKEPKNENKTKGRVSKGRRKSQTLLKAKAIRSASSLEARKVVKIRQNYRIERFRNDQESIKRECPGSEANIIDNRNEMSKKKSHNLDILTKRPEILRYYHNDETSCSQLPIKYPAHFCHQLPPESVAAVQSSSINEQQQKVNTSDYVEPRSSDNKPEGNIPCGQVPILLESQHSTPSTPNLSGSMQKLFNVKSLRELLGIDPVEYRLTDKQLTTTAYILDLEPVRLRGVVNLVQRLTDNELNDMFSRHAGIKEDISSFNNPSQIRSEVQDCVNGLQ